MKKYALVKDNVVLNVVVAESLEDLGSLAAYAVDCTDGWDFNNGIETSGFFPVPVTE